MVILRRGILLGGEQARQFRVAAERHRHLHRERMRRRRRGGAHNLCGLVGMVTHKEHRGLGGCGGPCDRDDQSECYHQDKLVQRPKPAHQTLRILPCVYTESSAD
jgi:hypothetical protein